MRCSRFAFVVSTLVFLLSSARVEAGPACVPALLSVGLLPDLQTVIPKHLGIQNTAKREYLRFTNGIANRGAGPLRLRPEPPPGTPTSITTAVQEILGPNGALVCEQIVSTFEYHPEHHHWHIGDVALFEVRPALDDGIGGAWGATLKNDRGAAQSVKVSFCLIDSYQLDSNSPTRERSYWDCASNEQGISSGWVDQYHQSLEGQEIDITGAPVGIYYLVTTSNPDHTFLENSTGNNTAWVSFRLLRTSRGNPKIEEIAQSPCDTPGMCGLQATNR